MKSLGYTIASVTLLGYLLLAVFGLMSMPSMHHSGASSMDACPFVIGEQSLCTMSISEHINSWQSLISVVFPNIVIIALPIFFVFFFLYLRPPNLAKIGLYIKPLRETFITSLFSQGILNAKVY